MKLQGSCLVAGDPLWIASSLSFNVYLGQASKILRLASFMLRIFALVQKAVVPRCFANAKPVKPSKPHDLNKAPYLLSLPEKGPDLIHPTA